MGRLQHSHLTSDPAPVLAERNTSNPTQDFFMSPSHAPVTSYLPAGFHDHALPLGKYYPSNYEQRNAGQSTLRPSVTGSLSSTIKSDSQVPVRHDAAHRATVESEVRRRLQQYQRDMMTQASMAASEILADPAGPRVKTGDTFTLNGLPIPEMRFNAPSHKPRTPNLLPLGSPGPVTPMELESAGGDYLAPSKAVGSQIDSGLTPPMVGLDPHST